jgi:anthranilate phosphoribosyltransferase
MFAAVLKNLGTRRAFIVHGADGLDEATIKGETRVSELKDGVIRTYNLDPVDYYGETYPDADLTGGDAAVNAQITKEVLTGADDGPRRKIVVLNAALAIVAGGKADTVREGIAVAEACIADGAALKKLQGLIGLSNS